MRIILFILFLVSTSILVAQQQELSNLRRNQIQQLNDTLTLDSLSIIPNSEMLFDASDSLLPRDNYEIDYAASKIYIKSEEIALPVKIVYRVLPLALTQKYAHKTEDQIEPTDVGRYEFFTIKEDEQPNDLFNLDGLNKNGSISRGVNFGNSQNLSVNSNLDLQLSGKISEDVSIQAAISDNNLPIQAEGNTQQLQDFDQVFIKLFTKKSTLTAGDFRITRPNSYFMNLNKKVQGGGFSTSFVTKEEANEKNNGTIKTSLNAAVSRGKFSRNVINGQEGIQGPYKLEGEEGEQFVIILSGTERVFVNGRLMTRGQDNDYVIDYNTAELTFTPNQMINKDMRIVVEFQYSERNYSRSVIFMENQYKKEKLTLDFNVYSEQDSKNQPLQQDLSDEEKRTLREAGDDVNAAVVSGIDSVGFLNDQVRYKLIDSLGQQILVFSKNPDSAIYSARFSRVGQGNGDYIQIRSDANGRVFRWVAPVNGVRQGSFAPVIRLVTPKQRQMVSFGGTYDFSKRTQLNIEGAFTNNDLNTFSTKDSEDDQSHGLKVNFRHEEPIYTKDSLRRTSWTSDLFFEQRGEHFQFVERYRDVEFERDWNLSGQLLTGEEYLVRAQTGIVSGQNRFIYEFGSFSKGDDFRGIKNGFNSNYSKKGFAVQSRGSYLTVDAQNKSEFIRHYTTVSQKIWGLKVGAYLEQERILFYQGESDSLQNNSFDRIIWKSFIEKGDTNSGNFYRLSYSEIYDYLPDQEDLTYAQKSKNIDFEFEVAANRNSRLSGKATHRKLFIENKELAIETPENTTLGRLQYDLRGLKGLLTSSTFYQLGSGLENRREFSFLRVNDGQGTHVWNDYNGNDVKELNEFEVAGVNNAFQANYIKVFTPTNDFVRVFSNQFNQVFFLKPDAILSGKKDWRKWVGKFSNKATYRAERRTQLGEDIYNPFNVPVEDTNLVAVNSSFSNTLYFNRLNSKFGIDFFYLNNTGKSLLTNGFESRVLEQKEWRARYNISRIYTIETRYTLSDKENRSEFFSTRNFDINTNEVEPKLIYQPSLKFRLTFSAIYSERSNAIGTEKSINRTGSTELCLNDAGKGTFSVSASYIDIDFNASENSSLAFEMLDGLRPGGNITWNILWQRNLANNLQLNLNYGGRRSDGVRVIHTGGMQLRAFF